MPAAFRALMPVTISMKAPNRTKTVRNFILVSLSGWVEYVFSETCREGKAVVGRTPPLPARQSPSVGDRTGRIGGLIGSLSSGKYDFSQRSLSLETPLFFRMTIRKKNLLEAALES